MPTPSWQTQQRNRTTRSARSTIAPALESQHAHLASSCQSRRLRKLQQQPLKPREQWAQGLLVECGHAISPNSSTNMTKTNKSPVLPTPPAWSTCSNKCTENDTFIDQRRCTLLHRAAITYHLSQECAATRAGLEEIKPGTRTCLVAKTGPAKAETASRV